jgi:hypothetical protein
MNRIADKLNLVEQGDLELDAFVSTVMSVHSFYLADGVGYWNIGNAPNASIASIVGELNSTPQDKAKDINLIFKNHNLFRYTGSEMRAMAGILFNKYAPLDLDTPDVDYHGLEKLKDRSSQRPRYV